MVVMSTGHTTLARQRMDEENKDELL